MPPISPIFYGVSRRPSGLPSSIPVTPLDVAPKSMDPMLISALVGAGTSLFNSIYNVHSQNKANAVNAYASELQYQRTLAMQNAQNEYNSPRNVMARYGQAGLNPHLIYDRSATPASSVSAPAPSQSVAPKSEFNLGDAVSSMMAFIQSKQAKRDDLIFSKQVKLLDSQINGVIYDNRIKKEQADALFRENLFQSEDSSNRKIKSNLETSGLLNARRIEALNIDLLEAQKDLADFDKTEREFLRPYTRLAVILAPEEARARINAAHAQGALSWQEYRFLDKVAVWRIGMEKQAYDKSVQDAKKALREALILGDQAAVSSALRELELSTVDARKKTGETSSWAQGFRFYVGILGQILGGAKDVSSILKK